MLNDQRTGPKLRKDGSRPIGDATSDPVNRCVERSRRWSLPVATLGCATLFGIAGAVSGIADEPKVTVTNLLQDPLGLADGLEVVSYVVAAPGGTAAVPRHRHHGDEFLYVLEGAVTVTVEGAAPVTVQKGEMFHVPYGIAHTAQNVSATEPGRVLVFHVKEAGKPVRVPAEGTLSRDYLERHPI